MDGAPVRWPIARRGKEHDPVESWAKHILSTFALRSLQFFIGFFRQTIILPVGYLRLNLTSFTSAELTAILVQLVIVVLVIRRSYAMTQGVPFSAPRLVVLPALILILWGVSELESILLTQWALPYLVTLDFGILVVTTLAFRGVAEGKTQVELGPSGNWSYKIGFSLAALFVGAFVIRLSIAVALFPSSLEFGSPPGGFPPVQQQIVLGVIDALFSGSVGLLVGRSLGIYRKVQAARAGTTGAEAR